MSFSRYPLKEKDIQKLLDALALRIVQDELPLGEVLDLIRQKSVKRALDRNKSKTKAARILGISRQLIYYYMDRYGKHDAVVSGELTNVT